MKDSDLHRRLIGFLEGKTSSGDWDKINKLAENEEFVTVLRQMDKLSRESCRPDKGRMWTEIYRYVRISRRRNFIRLWERVAVVLLPALIGIVLFFYFQYSRPEQHFIPGPVARKMCIRDSLYLMKAEAWNEYLAVQDEEHVYAPLNEVRRRAGIPDVKEAWETYAKNPGKVATKEGMRKIIHREWDIEFAFEGRRFWNLRRWLTRCV